MRFKVFITIFTLMLTLLPGLVFAEHVIDDSKNASYLFVISGTSGSLEGDTLTLNGVSNAVYFSDRPVREAGHISLSKFTNMWSEDTAGYKSDPPNAVLSILTKDGNKNVLMQIKDLDQKDGSIKMTVVSLKVKAPENFKAAALFIDEVGPGGVPPWEDQ